MLSKRNLFSILTLFGVILLLFLFPVVLKEYFNDYDVNHWAAEGSPLPAASKPQSASKAVYLGSEDTAAFRHAQEWASYRHIEFAQTEQLFQPELHSETEQTVSAFSETEQTMSAFSETETPPWLLLAEGSLFSQADPLALEAAVRQLTAYVSEGGTLIFCSMPDYDTIASCEALRQLLGIQRLRSPEVEVRELWLFAGFLLGGEAIYSLEHPIPWYDISAGTKTYLAGYLNTREALDSEVSDGDVLSENHSQDALSNEDMPAVLWRNTLKEGFVFAVNTDLMETRAALGLLDAMVYESSPYCLYPVINAQNLCITGFPDLTAENDDVLKKTYAFDSVQLCRDILWPSINAAAKQDGWQLSAFVSPVQGSETLAEPDMDALRDYLKYFNEEETEAGICLGRIREPDMGAYLTQLDSWLSEAGFQYHFSGGYLRRENEAYLTEPLLLSGLQTLVTEIDPDRPVVSWLTQQITQQNLTEDVYHTTELDDLCRKSLETSLGYANLQADIYSVLWPTEDAETWEQLAERFSAAIATYWKPFSGFDKTTISESDRRVRRFLNTWVTVTQGDPWEGAPLEDIALEATASGDTPSEATASGDTTSKDIASVLSIQVHGFDTESWLLLRTHGETIAEVVGGSWKQLEKDAWLLHLTEDKAQVVLKPALQGYFY